MRRTLGIYVSKTSILHVSYFSVNGPFYFYEASGPFFSPRLGAGMATRIMNPLIKYMQDAANEGPFDLFDLLHLLNYR